MDTKQALQKLFSLHQFGIKLGLENITNLCNYIGNPEKQLKAIHIAGSNGKGSTASFMASILYEAGYKVGLFTSPHFVSFTERIRIDGIEISFDYVREFMTELDSYIDEHSPTFFELTTAMAFKYFAENQIDYAVIETGLGGRLDATNLLTPMACVITSISHEHSNILGNSLEEIAREKAGIIKQNTRVFISKLSAAAENTIREIAEERGSKVVSVEEYTTSHPDGISIALADSKINLYDLPLKGYFQFNNAALAAITLQNIFTNISSKSVLTGLNNVVKNTGIWGRYEIYSHNPKVIFDAAHNTDGIDNFLFEFKKEYRNYSKSTLIFGAMKDKNITEILNKLSEYFDDIVVTSIEYERAATIEELELVLNKLNVSYSICKSPADYIQKFVKNRAGECLVILGSIYIVGEIKKGLL